MNQAALKSIEHQTEPSDLPQVIGGRWQVIRLLAQGGMGAVYVAKHKITGRLAAVKTLPFDPNQEGLLTRFQREAQVTAQIGHPGIVEMLDADQDPETKDFYIAMELLTGDTLREKMDKNDAKPEETLYMIYKMLDPLIASHRKGVVHRDLKPENVFVIKGEENEEIVKLLDFGIALQAKATRMTQVGLAMGTPGYMSPEQATDAANVNASTDIWSIGVMIYENFSNELPFDGPSPNSIVVASCTQEYTPLKEKVPDIDPRIEEIVDRCLRKKPEERFGNVSEVKEALRKVLNKSDGHESPIVAASASAIKQDNFPSSTSTSLSDASTLTEQTDSWSDELDFDVSSKSPVKKLMGGVAVLIGLIALGLGLSGAAPMGVAIGGVLAAVFVIATLVLMNKPAPAQKSKSTKKRKALKEKGEETLNTRRRTQKTKRAILAMPEESSEDEPVEEFQEKKMRTKGSPSGTVNIDIYGDFMDPSTHQALSAASYIQQRFAEDVTITWHDLPNRHRIPSNWAARAGIETFAQQGSDAFWRMCELLFQKGELRLPKLKGYAELLDLDVEKFLDAVEGTVHDEELAEEFKEAQKLGIKEAPAFVVRGRVLMGTKMMSSLGDVIEQILTLRANPVDPTQPGFKIMEEEKIPEEMGLRQILIKWAGATDAGGQTTRSRGAARDRAIRLRKRVSTEEQNFVSLARQFSDAPMEVGTVKLSKISQPVLKAIRKLKIGEVCEVVETEQGFHIYQRYS